MTTRTHIFPRGNYYIGDPCYVIPDENDAWDELIDNTGFFGLHTKDSKGDDIVNWDDGVFLYKGCKCFASGTAYGDGLYSSNIKTSFPVDAGLIGIIPLDIIISDKKVNDSIKLGAVRYFDNEFEVSEKDGIFYFGNIRINTN